MCKIAHPFSCSKRCVDRFAKARHSTFYFPKPLRSCSLSVFLFLPAHIFCPCSSLRSSLLLLFTSKCVKVFFFFSSFSIGASYCSLVLWKEVAVPIFANETSVILCSQQQIAIPRRFWSAAFETFSTVVRHEDALWEPLLPGKGVLQIFWAAVAASFCRPILYNAAGHKRSLFLIFFFFVPGTHIEKATFYTRKEPEHAHWHVTNKGIFLK